MFNNVDSADDNELSLEDNELLAVGLVDEAIYHNEPKKKERKRSETKTLYGSKAISELREKVIRNLSSTQEFAETVAKVAAALNISEKNAREILKNTEGMADTYLLRKYLRGAFMRSDVCANALVMCRIAIAIEKEIGEANEVIAREAMKTQSEQENSIEE